MYVWISSRVGYYLYNAMKKNGKKYIIRESELSGILFETVMNEVGRIINNRLDEVEQDLRQQAQTGDTGGTETAPIAGTAAQTGTTATTAPQTGTTTGQQGTGTTGTTVVTQGQNGTTPDPTALDGQDPKAVAQSVRIAKDEINKLLRGQENPNNSMLQWFLSRIFGGTPIWRWLCNMFGWGDGEDNLDGSGGSGSGDGKYAYRGTERYPAIKGDIDTIVVHCTATEEGKDVREADIRQMHLKRGFGGTGYNYVIDLDGTIEPGRPVGTVGAHCIEGGDSNLSYNYHSIGISYVGGVINSGKRKWDPIGRRWKTKWTAKDTRTKEQKAAMVNLINSLIQKYPKIKEIVGHRDAGANKSCPCFDAPAEYSRLIPADRPMTPIRLAGLQRGGGGAVTAGPGAGTGAGAAGGGTGGGAR